MCFFILVSQGGQCPPPDRSGGDIAPVAPHSLAAPDVKPASFPTEKTRFKTVHIDLVGPLPGSEGFRYILTALIDWASCS